jgi:hypothetical protein
LILSELHTSILNIYSKNSAIISCYSDKLFTTSLRPSQCWWGKPNALILLWTYEVEFKKQSCRITVIYQTCVYVTTNNHTKLLDFYKFDIYTIKCARIDYIWWIHLLIFAICYRVVIKKYLTASLCIFESHKSGSISLA